MSGVPYSKKIASASQADGDLLIDCSASAASTSTHRVTVEAYPGATGTVNVFVKLLGANGYNALLDSGAVASVNLAALTEPKHFRTTERITAFKFQPVNVVGSYSVAAVELD